MFAEHARIIRQTIPVRDALRHVPSSANRGISPIQYTSDSISSDKRFSVYYVKYAKAYNLIFRQPA